MKLKKIKTADRYQGIVDRYGPKGCWSNDYIQTEAESLIEKGKLYECCFDSNAFLFVEKDGFLRVYYYVNDPLEIAIFDDNEFVTEILYRDFQGEPTGQIDYLQSCGFRRHLTRDLMGARYAELTPSVPDTGLRIGNAVSLDEVRWAAELFNSTFDKWSGDYISPSYYRTLLDSNAILIAKDLQGNMLGAFESGAERNVNWLRHFAITESARGKGIGKALLNAVIEKGHVDEKSRYMLWVQHQNEKAVGMYQKKGFKYMGKSSLSMIIS